MTASPLLETTALCVSFGGVHANIDIDVRVEAGALVGLIGPNGAGKTTFVDAVTGFVAPSSGSIRFAGEDISRLRPHVRARRGLARTWQSVELFDDLTVADNLLVAADPPRWHSLFGDLVNWRPSRHAEEVDEALRVVGLEGVREELAGNLSHGQRKLIGIARAVASRPELLVLDEPAAGLDTTESAVLGTQLRRLVDDLGLTVFLIDHDMGLVLSVCDLIYVLDFGQVIASGTPAEVRRNPTVIEAYLGHSVGEAQLKAVASDGRVARSEEES